MSRITKTSLVRSIFLFSIWTTAACSTAREERIPEQEFMATLEVVTTAVRGPTPTPTSTALPAPSPVPTEEHPTLPAPAPTAELQTGRAFTETLILPFDDDRPVKDLEISRDGLHLAYTVEEDGQEYVIWDGKAGQFFDNIGLVTLSQDGQHLAYIAQEGEQEFVVQDGVPQRVYDEIIIPGSDNLLFSPDGQRLAYRARLDGKARIVVDGGEYVYAGIRMDIVFSPDSQHVAFVAGNLKDEWFIVLDGVESQKFDEIRSYEEDDFSFSPDSQRFAFQGRRGDDWFVVVDGVESEPLDMFAFEIVFSPDSQHVAYGADRNGWEAINMDGKALETYERAFDPVFSPDSQRLAYKASKGDGWFVVVDGVAGPINHGWPVSIEFSPDSQKLAYIDENDQKYLVINDEVIGPHRNISTVVFSPDSQHVAYNVYDGENWLVMVDGEDLATIEFRHYNHTFSPDSAHLVFSADLEDGEAVFIDGIPGKVYDKLLARRTIFFDAQGNIFYFAITEEGVYRVDEKLD